MKKDSQFGEMRVGIASQIDRVFTMAERATLAPMLLRLGVALAAIGGYAMAWGPTTFTSSASLGLILLALLPALFPRGTWPTVVIATMVLGYLVTTSVLSVPITAWRVVGIAFAIYLVHCGAAFAAVLPYDSVVSRGLFVPWLLRLGAVLALTVLVAAFVAALPAFVGAHRLVIASVAGFAAMLALSVYLLYLWQRRES